MYANCSKYQCGDQNNLQPNIESTGQNSGITNSLSAVEDTYYNNADAYCQVHPDRYPCPNFWLSEPADD